MQDQGMRRVKMERNNNICRENMLADMGERKSREGKWNKKSRRLTPAAESSKINFWAGASKYPRRLNRQGVWPQTKNPGKLPRFLCCCLQTRILRRVFWQSA